METPVINGTKDVLENVILLNDSILVRLDIKVSTMQLNAISTLNVSDSNSFNSPLMKEFYKNVGYADKVIVKLSKNVAADYPEIKLGSVLVPSVHDNDGMSIVNWDDEYELENVIIDWNHDKKADKSLQMNTIGIKYKVHAYRIFNAKMAISTRSPKPSND